jgi:hypothetical protein
VDLKDFQRLQTRGRIVWTEVPDPQGRNVKRRPCLILHPPTANNSTSPVQVVGGSSSPPQPGNEHLAVIAKGLKKPGGHPQTRLTDTTYFYGIWLSEIPLESILGIGGFLHEQEVLKLEQIIKSLSTDTGSPDHSPSTSSEPPPAV